MNITFRKKKFQKECNNHKLLVRTYGSKRAGLIRRRLDEIHAANSLHELYSLPGPRCHELTGNRQGQFSVDLDHPYRLLFCPIDDPLPRLPDGSLDRKRITNIRILRIEDTHG